MKVKNTVIKVTSSLIILILSIFLLFAILFVFCIGNDKKIKKTIIQKIFGPSLLTLTAHLTDSAMTKKNSKP